MPETKRPLTTKQAKLVKGIADGHKKQKAGQLAGYGTTPGSTSAIVSETLKNPKVQEAIDKAMVKLNITPERALKPIDDALNDDDLEMRLKGSDRALKIMGIANKGNGDSTINNFGQMVVQQKDKYSE